MLAKYATEPYAKAITAIIKEFDPEIVLYGATSIGRDLAPRVSARVHTGLTADCTKLEIAEDTKFLNMTRPAFGGNIMATTTDLRWLLYVPALWQHLQQIQQEKAKLYLSR